MSALLTVATPLIAKIAGGFLSKLAGDAGVAENDATNALVRLVNIKDLSLPEDGDVTDDILALIKAGIGTFQKDAGLDPTNLLNPETVKWIFDTCGGFLQQADPESKPDMPSPPADGTTDKLRYWIKPNSLPAISDGGDPLELLREAFITWAKFIVIDILEVPSQDEANCVIHSADLGGSGGTLADANVGPPDIKQNDLRFDSKEGTWDSVKFRYACVHEIGHILGLEHTQASGQIMSVVRQKTIADPTPQDVERLKEFWEMRDFSAELPPELQALKDTGSTIRLA